MTETEFADAQRELLSRIPQEFRATVSFMAWERGHSAGYGEVLMIVDWIVDALEKPIAEYTKRIGQCKPY